MINQKRLVKLLSKLLQIHSENPPGNEVEIAQFVAKDLKSLGLDVKIHTFKKNRPNVVATLKAKRGKRSSQDSILLSPHYDTVPAGTGWKFDPFSGRVSGGRIYGRGASDDKGNLACAMEALRSLVEEKVELEKDVILAATADEETGSHHGIIPLLQRKIIKPHMALILDSDDFNTIVSQKGLIHCRIQIFGKKAHGAYNWRGVNSIEIAARIIDKLKTHKFHFKKHHFLKPPTVNVGTIKGGDKVNIVADFCEFSVDTRYVPGMNPHEILNEFRKIIKTESKKFKIEIDDIQYPYEISCEHPLVKTYVNAARKMGIQAHLKGSEGATVISFFKKQNIPAIATGFGASHTAHSTDEYAEIKTLYEGSKVLERFIKDYSLA